LDKENQGTGNIRGLYLAADKPTTVQVSNCRFLGLNILRAYLNTTVVGPPAVVFLEVDLREVGTVKTADV
jgi:hypothetical protein